MTALHAGALRLFAVTGVDGRRHTGEVRVTFRDLAAVVAPSEYAPPGAAGLDDYRRAVERVFRGQAVLPAPPGVVFRDRDVLVQWLELHYFALLDALAYVEDRAMARVTVAHADAAPGEPPPLDEATEAALHDVLRVLRRHAVATVTVGDATAPTPAASFLVERARWDVFADCVAQESARLGALSLVLTGPWPPYDFVRMQFTN